MTGTITLTAYDLFFTSIKKQNLEFDNISAKESLWLENATIGALQWCRDGYSGPAYGYDITSFYPSILSYSHMNIPIKEGKFETINNLDVVSGCAIYRCIIHKSANANINRLFKFNQKPYYTSYDIKTSQRIETKHRVDH